MTALLSLTFLGLKLNFRNRMAILYGYLFPLIFLVAFWAVYRSDPVPLASPSWAAPVSGCRPLSLANASAGCGGDTGCCPRRGGCSLPACFCRAPYYW